MASSIGPAGDTVMKVVTGVILAAALAQAAPSWADSEATDCLRLAGENAVGHCTKALQSADAVPAARRADLYFARGRAYLYLQQYRNAAADFTVVIEQNRTSGDAYVDRGVAYHYLHQYELAIEDYSRAIALDSNLYAAYYDRALSYYRLGRFAEAWRDFDQAVKRDPRDAKALYGRGLSKARLGGSGEADFAAAGRLDPTSLTSSPAKGSLPRRPARVLPPSLLRRTGVAHLARRSPGAGGSRAGRLSMTRAEYAGAIGPRRMTTRLRLKVFCSRHLRLTN